MKNTSILLLLIFLFLPARAQNFVWMNHIGGTANESITDQAIDANQNLVYVGNAQGTVDLNPGGTNPYTVYGSVTSPKTFVSKVDPAGNILWVDTFGGSGYIHAESIAIDPGQYIYVTGFFNGTIDFDPGPGQQLRTSNSGNGSIYFMKLTTSGVLQWVHVLEGTASNVNQGYDIIVSKENGIYVSGTFGTGNIDFDPGPGTYLLTAPVRHIFVAKYGYDGSLIWAKSYGGDGPEESCVMDTDYEGNIYLTGQFSSHCDFDPGPGTEMPYPNYMEKLYVLKWDKDGNFKWVRCFVGTGGSSYSNDIDYDGHGHLYVCGGFSGTMDFNDGGDGGTMTSSLYSSTFAVKLDTAGNYKWSFSIDFSQAYGGHVDPYNNYYIDGYYHGNVDFDPGTGTYQMPLIGNVQSYIGKYDSAGQFIWAATLPSTNVSRAYTLDLDTSGSIYMCGQFNQTTDFDPGTGVHNVTGNGADDIYVLKLSQCYLNPGVSQQNQTLTAMATGLSYQWFDCATGQPVAGAINSSFTPTQSGSYAVALNSSGCIDTSACFQVTVNPPNSIHNPDVEEAIQLYPNPGQGHYLLQLPESLINSQISIYDLLGKERLRYSPRTTRTELLLDAPAGIYLMTIRLPDGRLLTRKITQAP